ncbi:hypothetical protein Hydth_0531 [Hydrogenobacter thermophilus TK-6]|uniref:Uncharacterized protein n=1 Tax=Hydrogenobacter thermophilus (strain DSM 6534 / IAM 12695 / TK-6) TaxID=608538 RepID=D3DGP4_HYDTT|nr:hypothetical protein [Hydrogenobacter thermophilus]ADO44931.1 hypothetical protein Hydth_0531 [Hydrogenobacter thermophilus TK-6]BAI68996.1 hypothetical protein HTH_0533 [Hydrogenobacter thermophilus TK-6]
MREEKTLKIKAKSDFEIKILRKIINGEMNGFIRGDYLYYEAGNGFLWIRVEVEIEKEAEEGRMKEITFIDLIKALVWFLVLLVFMVLVVVVVSKVI